MIKTLVVTLAVAAIAGTARESTAQIAPEAPKTPGWVLTPSVGVGGSWDDNVLMLNPGDNPPSDYATPVNPSLSLDYRGRRTWFTAGYEGAFLTYRTLGQLNSTEQHLRAFFQHRATPRLTLFAEETFAEAPTTDALVLSGIPFYRIGSQTNAAGGGFEAFLTRYTTMRGVYTLRSVTFDPDERIGGLLEGGHAHEASVTVSRMFSPRWTMGGQYELRRAVLSEGRDSFDIHTAGATAQYEATRATRLFAMLGVSQLGAGLRHEARTGPTVRVGVVRRVERATLSASYQRSFTPAFGFGGTFQNEEWQASAHVPFARNRAYLDSGVSWFDNDPLELDQPSLKSLWLSSTIGYRLTQWLNVEGYAGRTQQDAQRAGGELSRNQVGFRLVAVKPLKLD